MRETLPKALWSGCYVHFLRNAPGHLVRKADKDCPMELRWKYDRWGMTEARRDLAAWLDEQGTRYTKLCAWVEENIKEVFTFYSSPRAHHNYVKSTHMLKRFNQKVKRRTHILCLFSDPGSCVRLVRTLTAETREFWIEGIHPLNMDLYREHNKLRQRQEVATTLTSPLHFPLAKHRGLTRGIHASDLLLYCPIFDGAYFCFQRIQLPQEDEAHASYCNH